MLAFNELSNLEDSRVSTFLISHMMNRMRHLPLTKEKGCANWIESGQIERWERTHLNLITSRGCDFRCSSIRRLHLILFFSGVYVFCQHCYSRWPLGYFLFRFLASFKICFSFLNSSHIPIVTCLTVPIFYWKHSEVNNLLW